MHKQKLAVNSRYKQARSKYPRTGNKRTQAEWEIFFNHTDNQVLEKEGLGSNSNTQHR